VNTPKKLNSGLALTEVKTENFHLKTNNFKYTFNYPISGDNMRYNILIGGAAGQGINKISQIISDLLSDYGYFTFNYRDYPSLIRGGHNFNVLSLSDKQIMSTDSKIKRWSSIFEKIRKL